MAETKKKPLPPDMFEDQNIPRQKAEKSFTREPDWEDMLAMLRHYGNPKSEAWLERQMKAGLPRKEQAPKPWDDLGEAARCTVASRINDLLHSTAVANGWEGEKFSQRWRYND